ncbi:MAG: alpha/beta hydrolase [Alphaproteobacteria bacterium]|nr:alpha/beta hydrolase [Alphaproteobacteria bacterium]
MTDHQRWWRRPATIRRAYADARFGQIHYRIAEPAKPRAVPLVFFHQSPSSGRPFEDLLARLGTDRIAIAPDTPGFGDSDPPLAPPMITDYAGAMGDLLDALKLGPVDLFGDHTGAKVAVELAQQRPRQVRRLVLNAAPVYSATKMAEMMGHLEEEKPKLPPADGSHLVKRWQGMRKWYPKDIPADLFERDFYEGLRGLDLAWYGHNAAFAYSHADNLPNVAQPILVLCPNDGLWEATQAARPYLKHGRIHELPYWAMGAVSSKAEEMSAIVRAFLDGPAEAGAPPAPKAAPGKPTALARGPRRRFVVARSGQVHARICEPATAKGRPVVCLHMSPVSSRNFVPLLQELGQDRVAVALDIPGFGESDAPPTAPAIADLSAAIAEAVLALGLKGPIDMYGDHTGATITIDLAVSRPDLVRRFALNTVPLFTAEERKARLDHACHEPAPDDGSHLPQRWAGMTRLTPPGLGRFAVERNLVESTRGGAFGHWGHRAVFSYAMEDVLPRIAQPVLVFRPRDGLETHTARALTLMKTATLHDLPRDRFGFTEERPKEFSRILKEFFDG